MFTIGQISEMFKLPISTLRYYDREGLFPHMQRHSGIRQFGDVEVETLRVIECLKASGLEIREIKQFMEWTTLGSATYAQRKQQLCVEAGYPASLVRFRNGLHAVAACPSDTLHVVVASLRTLRERGICPSEGWILMNE